MEKWKQRIEGNTIAIQMIAKLLAAGVPMGLIATLVMLIIGQFRDVKETDVMAFDLNQNKRLIMNAEGWGNYVTDLCNYLPEILECKQFNVETRKNGVFLLDNHSKEVIAVLAVEGVIVRDYRFIDNTHIMVKAQVEGDASSYYYIVSTKTKAQVGNSIRVFPEEHRQMGPATVKYNDEGINGLLYVSAPTSFSSYRMLVLRGEQAGGERILDVFKDDGVKYEDVHIFNTDSPNIIFAIIETAHPANPVYITEITLKVYDLTKQGEPLVASVQLGDSTGFLEANTIADSQIQVIEDLGNNWQYRITNYDEHGETTSQFDAQTPGFIVHPLDTKEG